MKGKSNGGVVSVAYDPAAVLARLCEGAPNDARLAGLLGQSSAAGLDQQPDAGVGLVGVQVGEAAEQRAQPGEASARWESDQSRRGRATHPPGSLGRRGNGRRGVDGAAQDAPTLGRPTARDAQATRDADATDAFYRAVRDAETGARPRWNYLRCRVEHERLIRTPGAASEARVAVWAEGQEENDLALCWSRWSSLNESWAAMDTVEDADAAVKLGRAIGSRGDLFAEWLGCEVRELVGLLERVRGTA